MTPQQSTRLAQAAGLGLFSLGMVMMGIGTTSIYLFVTDGALMVAGTWLMVRKRPQV